jgi:hypothetical protein
VGWTPQWDQARPDQTGQQNRRAGQYSLPRSDASHANVFEGTLPESTVQELRSMVDADQLRQLAQDQIKVSFMSESLDQFMISVFRDERWKHLTFATSSTRKPYKNSLDPLLKWLDQLQKNSRTPSENLVANRCIPQTENPANVASASTPAAPNATKQPSANQSVAGSNPYLMRMIRDHYYRGEGQRTCVIVYDNGTYRTEKSKQVMGASASAEVFQDSVDQAAIRDLREILEAPDLKTAKPGGGGLGASNREGEVTILLIPRKDQVQQLSFSSLFAVEGSLENISKGIDNDLGLLKPVQKWVKANTDSKKTPVKDASATDCLPAP